MSKRLPLKNPDLSEVPGHFGYERCIALNVLHIPSSGFPPCYPFRIRRRNEVFERSPVLNNKSQCTHPSPRFGNHAQYLAFVSAPSNNHKRPNRNRYAGCPGWLCIGISCNRNIAHELPTSAPSPQWRLQSRDSTPGTNGDPIGSTPQQKPAIHAQALSDYANILVRIAKDQREASMFNNFIKLRIPWPPSSMESRSVDNTNRALARPEWIRL